jgi:hypothetical protein
MKFAKANRFNRKFEGAEGFAVLLMDGEIEVPICGHSFGNTPGYVTKTVSYSTVARQGNHRSHHPTMPPPQNMRGYQDS